MTVKPSAPQYLFSADSKPSLPLVDIPLVRATESSLRGYGCLVRHPDQCDIEIVKWPAQGWRPVDDGTGVGGGITEGIFCGEWKGDILMGENSAVGGRYVLGWACDPRTASENSTGPREQVLLWHFNYHPDGGQLFFPLDKQPFVVPVALPGDDLRPEQVVALWCDGSTGLYIHPGIWHEGVFPVRDRQRFLDRQGRVHARVSCDFGEEFGVYLKVPLRLNPES